MKFSFLDLVYIKEGYSTSDAYTELKNTAIYAEKLGFERLWLAEHHNMEGIGSCATSVLIGYVASQTKKMRIGSGGIMLPNHSALAISEQFGTLAHLYPDRIDLGLGRAPGTDGLTAQFMNENFFKNVQEFSKNISLIQKFFSTDNQNSKVRAYVAEGTNVPIYILGSSTESALLSAALGLPYAFASHFAPQQLGAAFKLYEQNFQASKKLQKPYKIACVNIIIGESTEEARLLASSFYKMFLGIIRNERSKMQLPNIDFYNEWTVNEEALIRQMTSCTFIGNYESVARNLLQFINRYEVDEIMISCPIYSQEKRLFSMQEFAAIISNK